MEKNFDEIIKKLKNHEKRIKEIENIVDSKKETLIKKDFDIIINKFSKDVGVNEEKLKFIFDFDDENFRLITVVEGKNEIEKQLRATICILTAHHYYGTDEIKTKDLRKQLEWLGIRSLVNLSTNLSKYPQLIIPKGQSKSPDFSYRLTFPGLKKGLEIIKNLCESRG